MSDQSFHVAIVGGGISGLSLALGLIKRNISVHIYEQAHAFREVGAGLGFTPNAVRCMQILHPGIKEAFLKVRSNNMSPDKQSVFFSVYDGFAKESDNPEANFLYDEKFREPGGISCHRAHFLDELIKLAPPGITSFQKHLDNIEDRGDGKKLLLSFHDGTTAEADAVIGCDGVKSRVRQLIVGEDHPAANPSYSHHYAIRGLLPMAAAIEAVGEAKATNNTMYVGPGAHVVTFPVAGGKVMNVAGMIHDSDEWPDSKRITLPSHKAEMTAIFNDWGHDVRSIMSLLLEDIDKWGVFDTYDNPLPTFMKGRIVVLGDAAHASSPHLASGAGFCIEDATVMAELLGRGASVMQADPAKTNTQVFHAAFAAYEGARKERSQWLVRSSRFVGLVQDCRAPGIGNDPAKMSAEVERRTDIIWNHDEKKMLADAFADFDAKVQ